MALADMGCGNEKYSSYYLLQRTVYDLTISNEPECPDFYINFGVYGYKNYCLPSVKLKDC